MARIESPDEVLVMAAILGNLEAFEELVLRYRAAVVRLAGTIVSNDDAEDVAQDALLLAFKALPTLEEPTKFAAWLSAITRHRAFRFSKRERAQTDKRVAMDEVLLEKIDALNRPLIQTGAVIGSSSNIAGIKSDGLEVMSMLNDLPNEYALPLKLRFHDEMPLKRIAAFMGVPLSTVKWRLHQGKKLLRERLEEQ